MRLRYIYLFMVGMLFSLSGYAQDSTGVTPAVKTNVVYWPFDQTEALIDSIQNIPEDYWSEQNRFGIDFNEVTFANWNAGGSNSVSLLFSANIKRTYERNNLRWQNEIIARYGINAQKDQKLRKTDDQLEINSTFGYRADTTSGWFYSAKFNFKSQIARGYKYPNRDEFISSFMAPAYMFFGVGAEFGRDSDVFTLYISPATEKSTFVLNQRLANEGAFGVTGAVYDANGVLIKEGKQSRTEFGILITNEYNFEVFKNVELNHRISLYTDYIKDFGNVDIDWQLNLSFKVNDYIAAKIGSHLIYDNDIKTKEINPLGEEVQRGAKVQWKQQLGVGLVVNI